MAIHSTLTCTAAPSNHGIYRPLARYFDFSFFQLPGEIIKVILPTLYYTAWVACDGNRGTRPGKPAYVSIQSVSQSVSLSVWVVGGRSFGQSIARSSWQSMAKQRCHRQQYWHTVLRRSRAIAVGTISYLCCCALR